MPLDPLRLAILALATFLAGPPTPANAETNNQRTEKEARSYLTPCDQTDRDLQLLCRINQRNFINRYVWAKAGDALAMGSTAASFGGAWWPDAPESVRLHYLGMPTRPIESCAWYLLRLARNAEPTMRVILQDVTRNALGRLADFEQPMCKERAEAIDKNTRTRPVRRPSLDWEPAIPSPAR